MEIDIKSGMRVLYKNGNSGWLVGNIAAGKADITELGLFIPVIPKNGSAEKEIHFSEINNMYLDSFKIEDWVKEYKKYFMTKDEYIKFIESDDFSRQIERAYVSDGEYGYYPVSKFSKNWIEKQPFDYVVRGD